MSETNGQHCDMGVGCEDAGECFAASQGDAGRCGLPDTAQLRARVAELEVALREVLPFVYTGLSSRSEAIRDRIRAALSGDTSALDAAIATAVRAEREACAEVLRKRRNKHHRAAFNAELQVEQDEAELREIEAHECMEAIRARGES